MIFGRNIQNALE